MAGKKFNQAAKATPKTKPQPRAKKASKAKSAAPAPLDMEEDIVGHFMEAVKADRAATQRKPRGKKASVALDPDELKHLLFAAVSNKNLTDVKTYVEKHGVPLNVQTDNGMTPLHLAAEHGHVAVLRYLISKGADMNAQDRNGYSPLMHAVEGGDLPCVNALLKAKADTEIMEGIAGATALNIAAFAGESTIAEALAKGGAQVNTKDNYGTTPLMSAAEGGHIDIIKCLIAHGATLDDKEKNSHETALMLAAGSAEAVGLLIAAAGAGASTLVNVKDFAGKTPLMHACSEDAKTVDVLLKAGAKVDDRDNAGRTALMHAVNNSACDVIRHLIRAGADTKLTDNAGRTIFDLIADRDYWQDAMPVGEIVQEEILAFERTKVLEAKRQAKLDKEKQAEVEIDREKTREILKKTAVKFKFRR